MFNLEISDRTYAEMFCAVTGLFISVYGNGKRAQFGNLQKNGIRVEGEVVEIKSTNSGGADDSRISYYPVIRFEPVDGSPIAADYSFVSSNPCTYKLWETVPVLYDANDPGNFMLDNKSSKIRVPVIMFVGAAMLVASIIFYILDLDSYIRF